MEDHQPTVGYVEGLCIPTFSHTIIRRSTRAFQLLKDTTLFFSCSTPNLATIIPVMDVIDKKLTTDSLDRSRFEAPICTTLGLAKNTLNRYYNLTDSSEVYRIAMGMYHFILPLPMYVTMQCYTLKNAGYESLNFNLRLILLTQGSMQLSAA